MPKQRHAFQDLQSAQLTARLLRVLRSGVAREEKLRRAEAILRNHFAVLADYAYRARVRSMLPHAKRASRNVLKRFEDENVDRALAAFNRLLEATQ